jgi:hypothetical protein
MGSKRIFKKNLDKMVIDALEECYSVQLYNSAKADVSNQLIDEIVDFRDKMAVKIHQAKTKKDYPSLIKEAEDASVDFTHKINGLH